MAHAAWQGFVGFYNSNDLTYASSIAFFALLDIAAAGVYLIATRTVRERLLRESEPAFVTQRSGESAAEP